MAISLRLSRGGAKKRPYYRIVAADSRSPRDGKFLEQIGYVADEFEVVEAQGKHVETRPRFTYRGSSGIIEASLDNVVKALSWRDGLGIRLVYDKFRDAIIYRTQGSPEWQELTDDSYTSFRLRLTAIGMDATIPKQHVIDAVSYVAKKNAIDSAQPVPSGPMSKKMCLIHEPSGPAVVSVCTSGKPIRSS